MKRHIFYIAVIAALSLSAAVSTITTHASNHSKAMMSEASAAKPAVTEVMPSDAAPVAKDRPVVIDFYATWCGPCKTYKPVFDKVANDYIKKASFFRVDVDKCRSLAEEFSISSIPTIVIITPDGKLYRSTGAISETQLRYDIDLALK